MFFNNYQRKIEYSILFEPIWTCQQFVLITITLIIQMCWTFLIFWLVQPKYIFLILLINGILIDKNLLLKLYHSYRPAFQIFTIRSFLFFCFKHIKRTLIRSIHSELIQLCKNSLIWIIRAKILKSSKYGECPETD